MEVRVGDIMDDFNVSQKQSVSKAWMDLSKG